VKTVVLASCTPEEEAMLAERRRLDQDRLDEVWQGEYHMNPGPHSRHGRLDHEVVFAVRASAKTAGLQSVATPNIGRRDDFRVPDHAYLRPDQADAVYLTTAAIVVEIVSPGDESWLKFDFYAAHDVDELVIVDGDTETVHWFVLRNGVYEAVDRSALLDLDVAAVEQAIDW
jgi:Uma2 family endonuclease